RDAFGSARTGDYFALLGYFAPSHEIENEVSVIRAAIRNRRKLATTFGYGPQYLHSTGQIHKGGPDKGLFLMLTQENDERLPIPGEPYDFTMLNQAQYLGDYQALLDRRRRVIRIN